MSGTRDHKTKKQKQGYAALMKAMSKIAFTQMPLFTAAMLLVGALEGLVSSAGVWFKQQLFDNAQSFVEGGAIGGVYLSAVLLGLFVMIQLVMRALNNYCLVQFDHRLEQKAGSLMNEKAARVQPICYENDKFLNHVEKARRGLNGAIGVFDVSVAILLTFVCYFGFMGVYLFRTEPSLLVMLLISFVPYIFGGYVRYRQGKKVENAAAPYRRRGEYYGRCITDREYVKETRLLGAYGYFFRLFDENMRTVRDLDWKATRKSEVVEILLRFISMAGYLGTILLMFYYLLEGRIGVGAFAAISASLDGMSDKLDVMFRTRISVLLNKLGMAENYLEFMELPEKNVAHWEVEGRAVSLEHVSFLYPDAKEYSLKDINLHIAEKETVAIVGSNGAGKSTLARLMIGLYEPTSGSVKIDGADTRQLNPADAAKNISAVFQRFQRYKMNLRKNVVISDWEAKAEDAAVKAALEKADLDWADKGLPEQLDTMLSREFGGVDLSGGQWQRIAIARGLYRSHNMIILDEPTAAIDPLEETAVYQKFMELSRDKTAVIITHRLGSARLADRIVVLNQGEIAEIGTHEELLKKDGLYSEMYEAQAKWYA